MPSIQFDRFYKYDELTPLLQHYAAEFPELVSLCSMGKSYEGRDIWLLTVTNFTTGLDTEKPAFYVDGNIHAIEVSASTACLHHLHHLVNGFGQDETITRCLNTRAFYIVPRLNPDGAEWALADHPKIIRSSTRAYPREEDPVEGLLAYEDIDDDGRILQMRLPDPNGAWKPHPGDPRLMVRRDAIETGGNYYRLLPEGRVVNYDGVTIKIIPPKQGLDLNRNFPMEWRQEHEQRGAGPYPTSEPEVRAVADFFSQHNNICGVVTFHTNSGVILRPYASKSDDELPVNDLWTYQKLGQKGTDLTGYPAISIFHDFKYHPKQVITGGFDWTYEHLGMFFFVVELWSPMRQAGIKDFKFIDWYREHPLEDDLAMMKWNDEILGGKGYVNWYAYQHPELGTVELGGWDTFQLANPPASHLENEVKPFTEWLTWQAMLTPRLVIRNTNVKRIDADTYHIRTVVDNEGWLPTNVTEKALLNKRVRGVICEIEIPVGASLEMGRMRDDFGQLSGRAYKPAMPDEMDESTTDRLKVEWVVRAPNGGRVKIIARHERAGIVRAEVDLV